MPVEQETQQVEQNIPQRILDRLPPFTPDITLEDNEKDLSEWGIVPLTNLLVEACHSKTNKRFVGERTVFYSMLDLPND